MKSCLDIRATDTEWINGIQKIMLEFMITQMTENQSQSCQPFESLWIVRI